MFVVKYITAALTKESEEETISHEPLRPRVSDVFIASQEVC